jgi:hypothetical protein
VVSECGRARSREDGRCSWSYYAAAAAAGREERRWVEVVEARFWLVLALPVRTWAGWRWLSMVTKDTPGRQATRGERLEQDYKSGRQAAM